jgi:hypothetical protein
MVRRHGVFGLNEHSFLNGSFVAALLGSSSSRVHPLVSGRGAIALGEQPALAAARYCRFYWGLHS